MNGSSFCSAKKKFERVAIIIQLLIFPVSFQSVAQDFHKQFNDVVGHSNFIFSGTITYLDSSNVAVKLQKRNKAIVRVDEVIDATEPLFNMKGKEITLVFASNSNHAKKNKEVFYTFIWYYGNTLGVKEVKNNLDKTFQPELPSQIQRARTKILDDSLSAELARAKIVVLAVVKNVGEYLPVKGLEQSEHNPRFHRAVFEIKEVLKGKPTKDSLSVYYASSYDAMWASSPKLSGGLEGIFLLQDKQIPGFLKLNGYTVLDARDFQHSDQLKKIKGLLEALSHK